MFRNKSVGQEVCRINMYVAIAYSRALRCLKSAASEPNNHAAKVHVGRRNTEGRPRVVSWGTGEIEYVVDGLIGDAKIDWHMREHGPGVLVSEPKHFGRAYIREMTHLVFVSRAEPN